jgi:hypothetical protein
MLFKKQHHEKEAEFSLLICLLQPTLYLLNSEVSCGITHFSLLKDQKIWQHWPCILLTTVIRTERFMILDLICILFSFYFLWINFSPPAPSFLQLISLICRPFLSSYKFPSKFWYLVLLWYSVISKFHYLPWPMNYLRGFFLISK